MRQVKTALVTGASKGIGYDLARILARESHNLILVSRNKTRLKEIQQDFSGNFSVDVQIIAQDLSVGNAAVDIFNKVKNSGTHVDILVNNAGAGDFGVFNQADFQRISKMLYLNIVSLTELTRLFLPQMVERKEGKILNVASLAAFLPGPYMAVYYASKAYVKSFSEAISSELRGTGVTVTALCPGLTKTGFQKEVGSESSNVARLGLMASSESVAEIGYKAMLEGREIVVPGIINSSIARTSKIIPTNFKTRIIRAMQELNRMKIV